MWSAASEPENVFYWSDASQRFGDGHLHLISYIGTCYQCPPPQRFNGASMNPSMSSRGNYIAFTSSTTGVAGESNGSAINDVFLEHYADAPRGSLSRR